ncbi:sorting nexin-3 isoform X1 [Lampris incognitus]|uniref:sorting nexin-3 isoform X1 n=1 Tax=Lampris incognitus TaxID=2546036 RepID=UPI0024B54A98|nr:sorting nexin-3 isoform X1 [Lampris incognitus]
MADTIADTRRLYTKPQTLNDAYGPPSNFLEIDVSNPETVGVGRGRFTTYEIRLKTNLPIFKLKESRVRRRYSDFEWLRAELERESKVVVPPLPGKALIRQLPFRGDDGIFDDSFIEERRQGLEQFLNKRNLWTRATPRPKSDKPKSWALFLAWSGMAPLSVTTQSSFTC